MSIFVTQARKLQLPVKRAKNPDLIYIKLRITRIEKWCVSKPMDSCLTDKPVGTGLQE